MGSLTTLRVDVPTEELVDAGEGLSELLDSTAIMVDVCPALLRLLLDLNEAITETMQRDGVSGPGGGAAVAGTAMGGLTSPRGRMENRGADPFVAAATAVNGSIYEFARRGEFRRAEPWEFFCECGEYGCFERVLLASNEYEDLRERAEPILADGHALSPARRERRRAAALQADAGALRSEAKHQVKRARRNRR